jgi:hypothetical protein
MVTSPSQPARLAARGYAGRISPRGRGMEVADHAVGSGAPAPACPDCSPPLPGPADPKREPVALVSEPAEAGARAVVAAPSAELGSPTETAPGSPVPAGVSACCAAGAGAAGGGSRDGGGADGVGTVGRAAPRIAGAAGCISPAAGTAGRDARLTSMVGVPRSPRAATRGTRRMTACRQSATRSERPNPCHGFTAAPPTVPPYNFTLTPVWMENGGMG